MPNILFIGDIVGKPGRMFLKERLQALRDSMNLDLVIANAENAAGGSGLTSKIAFELRQAGVDGITLGDHVWDQRGFDSEIAGLTHVCRPANLPPNCPGRSYLVLTHKDFRLGVVTVLGSQFMKIRSGCAFRTIDRILKELEPKTDAVMVEMHAETTSEKTAIGWYLDGRVAGVLGTHTHIPTADGRVLPRGAAYVTDVGMTGPYASCLGREVQPVVAHFLDGMPRRFAVAQNDVRLCGALLEIDGTSGTCRRYERVEVIE